MTQIAVRQFLLSHWQTILLSMMLVFAQLSSVIHSEIHPFHDHSEFCDVFYGVEHQSTDAVSDFAQSEHSVPSFFEPSYLVFALVSNLSVVYFCRAPPVI